MNAARRPATSLSLRRQQGMSMLFLLAVLGVAMSIGTFAFTVGPAYMEYMTISKIASDKARDETLMRASRSKVYRALAAAYDTNNLWDMKAEDTIRLEKDAERGYVMTVAYEKRSNLFANIDVVTVFDKEAVP